jgi:arylsulfatase A-like enzyme
LKPAAALLMLLLAGCGRELPPNLLLITVDTLRPDRLACYGGPAGSGERLCAIFRDGTRYAWAFTPAPYTAPAVASLLTSAYPSVHGVTQSAASFLELGQESVAETLAGAGYTTAAFVSNPVLDRARNFGQGFGVYDAHMSRRELNRRGYVEREAHATTDAVLAWAEVAAEEPWFVWVHYQDPHGPYDPPGAVPRANPPGAALLPRLADDSGHAGIPAYQALPGHDTLAAYSQRYLDEIAYLDGELARLAGALDARGRRPAILLAADHGEAFGEDDYYFAHGHSLGLDQIRVPLLYRPAAGRSQSAVAEPVSLLDVAPTLLTLAGVAMPQASQGRVLPGVGPPGGATPARFFFAEHGRQAAVIAGVRVYTRDRGEREGRHGELGQELPARPARVAELPEDGPNPPYRPADPAGADAALERELAAHLRGASAAGARHGEVDPELRERMRALGYAE